MRMLNHLRPALVLLALMTLLTGLAYPLAMTGIATTLLPDRARASLIARDGVIVGSRRVAQGFAAPGYFHPRPSAVDYDAAASGASNLGPTSATLIAAIAERTAAYQSENGVDTAPIDAVTSSGSGLDPDISLADAVAQTPRVAAARGVKAEEVAAIIDREAQGRLLGVFGTPRVNVLVLNLALDEAFPLPSAPPKE
jgi:K+-transporting ATPase ATPase C chain